MIPNPTVADRALDLEETFRAAPDGSPEQALCRLLHHERQTVADLTRLIDRLREAAQTRLTQAAEPGERLAHEVVPFDNAYQAHTLVVSHGDPPGGEGG